jgi:hypothetical protein
MPVTLAGDQQILIKIFFMKLKSTIILLAIITALISSCYKTGEIIYQPACKPAELHLPNNMYNLVYGLRFEFFDGNFTYNGSNNRPSSATSTLLGKLYRQYVFEYDENKYLVKVKTIDINRSTIIPIIYINYHYPGGTKNSITDKIETQFYYLKNDGISYSNEPLLSYQYNIEFQLTSIYEGTQLRETYTYDPGGNCTRNNVYDVNGNVSTWFQYDAYDNQINPARADRALQLFLNIYSKNNPTDMKRYVSGFGVLANNQGSYFYNGNGYPILYNGDSFAAYNCIN